MNKVQWNYVKRRLIIFGLIALVIIGLLALCFEWLWTGIVIVVATAVFIGYAIAFGIAVLVYKWRVMGATDDDEESLFNDYWHCTILDGSFDRTIDALQDNYDQADIKGFEDIDIEYLEKIKEVKRPKILE